MQFEIQTKQNYRIDGSLLASKLEELQTAGAEIIRVLPIENEQV